MSRVSDHYRKLNPDEISLVASKYRTAWQDPAIPERQFQRVTKPELEAFRLGQPVLPFDVLVKCLASIHQHVPSTPTLLDVGASSGYYKFVLDIAYFFGDLDYHCDYTALDFSESFRELARRYFPGVNFQVGDASKLHFADNNFDIVLHSAVIMHMADYRQAIAEAARVAKSYVIFHRTPVTEGPTAYFVKEGYEVPMLEIVFNEPELLQIFNNHGLELDTSFPCGAMKSYVLKKAH